MRALILLPFILFATTLNASMQSVYDDWFNQLGAYTAPGEFESSIGNGYFGGRFTVKSQISTITPVQFVPPSIDSGCGGIDFFGGSFSFIDSDQFETLLRNVSQNAKGYMFHLLLDSVFPEGSKIIEMIQKKVQELNQYLGNSCQLAQGIVDGGVDAVQTMLNTEKNNELVDKDVSKDNGESLFEKQFGQMKQAFQDDMTAFGNKWSGLESSDSTENACDQFAQEGGKMSYPKYNAFWFLIKCKKYDKNYPPEARDDLLQAMMSLYGTIAIRPSTDEAANTTVEPKRDRSVQIPLIDITQFYYGGTSQLYQCDTTDSPFDCMNLTVKNESLGYSFRSKVRELLLGGEDQNGNPDPTKPGIVHLIRTNGGADLTDQHKNTLIALGPRAQDVRNVVIKAPERAQNYIESAIDFLAFDAVDRTVKEINQVVLSAVNSSNDPLLEKYEEQLRARVEVLNKQLLDLRLKLKSNEDAFAKYSKILQAKPSTNYMPMVRAN